MRDVAGNSITLSNDPQATARNGQDLQLGLDSALQYWAEQNSPVGRSGYRAWSDAIRSSVWPVGVSSVFDAYHDDLA